MPSVNVTSTSTCISNFSISDFLSGIKNPGSPILEKALKQATCFFPVLGSCAFAAAIISDLDPLGIYDPIRYCRGGFSFVVKLIFYTLAHNEQFKSLCATFFTCFIVMQATTIGIFGLIKTLKKDKERDLDTFRMFKILQVWNVYYNMEFCHYIAPPLIFFGISVCVLANFATIKMYRTLPIMVYLEFPVVSMLAYGFLATALPRSVMVHEVSSEYLRVLRAICIRRYEKKLIRSLRPMGVRVGHFGTITKNWVVTICQNIVVYTMNLLLTY